MASDTDTSEFFQSESDEGDEDDHGDLSTLGATATTVKFQTVQQETFQRTERGTERLAQQILGSCQPSNQDLVPTSTSQNTEQLRDIPAGTRVLQQNFIQVKQQFGDVSVQGTRNLTIGGTQNIGTPGTSCDDKPLTWIQKIQNRTVSRINEWTKGMALTSALDKVMQKLNTGTKWITIKGSPGEGKTTVAYMALEELHKTGRQVFQVTSPKEFSKISMDCPRPVIMLDDIFGNLEFDQVEWNRWKSVLRQVLDTEEHRSGGMDQSTRKDVTVILVARDYVLNKASCDMGRIADFFTRSRHVVYMSHTQERKPEEKLSILKAVSDSFETTLDQGTVDKICQSSCPHGFPHVCRLFLTIRKTDPEITAETFFKAPLEFLNQTVYRFTHDKLKLLLFKEMIKGDGKVTVRELGQLENGCDTIQTAYDLVGTYLRKEDDYFLFDHPSIYDSVAYHLCKLHPLFVIENCNLQFIHERLRLQESGTLHTNTQKRESGLFVIIPRSYSKDLALRFAAEIANRNLVHVLSHGAFTDELFIQEVMLHVSVPLTDLMKLSDRNSGELFLSLLASNKSRTLLKYVEDKIGVPLTREEINTVLYGVCKYAALDVLTFLTETRDTLDINVRYGNSETPIMKAAETRDIEFVNEILSLSPDLKAHDRHGQTVLHYLCENGLVSAVKLAVEMGADINAEDNLKQTPLCHACRSSHEMVVKLLVDRGAKLDGKAVAAGCKSGNMDIVRLLFEAGATANMLWGAPLKSASEGGHMEVISFLIEKGASLDTPKFGGESPLHLACRYDKPEVVDCLLENGATIDYQVNLGETPLHVAARHGSKSCIDVLVKHQVDVNVHTNDGTSPLHIAAEKGLKECVNALLTPTANANIQSKDGYTPLHKAAGTGSEECVHMLLKTGAGVNEENKDGRIPLHTAVYYKPHFFFPCLPNLSVCRTLIGQGANVNKKDKGGNTPLHHLCWVDSSTELATPMFRSSASSYEDVYRALVTLFMDRGADINIQNNRGEPALQGWCRTLVKNKIRSGMKRKPVITTDALRTNNE